MLAFEIEKYRALNRADIEAWYRRYSEDDPSTEIVTARIAAIRASLDGPQQ